MSGPSPGQHEQIDKNTNSLVHLLLKRGEYGEFEYVGQMMFGERLGQKFPDNCQIVEKSREKSSPGKFVLTGIRTRPAA